MRLIDADLLLIGIDSNIARLRAASEGNAIANKAIDLLQTTRDYVAQQPTIDPESLRPQGEWKIREFPITKTKKISCGCCGYSESKGPAWDKSWGVPSFCQNCGAKMKEATP